MAQTDTLFLKKLLESKSELFSEISKDANHHEVQIMYTQVNRDKHNKPSFKTFGYRVDDAHYFYPASTVKLAAVIFALEKINDRQLPAYLKYLPMHTDSAFAGQTKVITDTSAANGQPAINHYIKKILLTSDNDAFNRLYEFVGRAEMNDKLRKYGLTHSRIINRLAVGDAGESTKHTNPIKILDELPVYEQPAVYDDRDYPLTLNNLLVGKGYLNEKDELVNEPFDFSNKNVFTIADQQRLLRRLMMPEAFEQAERFNLTPADYELIYKYMSMYPTESNYPKYNAIDFWPTYAKMLFYGREKVSPEKNIRIFNKYGDSYGFVIDNAYFVDFENNVEFFLTAVIQSNENGIYNDNKYEYDTICYPFLKNLGKCIYEYELDRKKSKLPNLQKFKMNYN